MSQWHETSDGLELRASTPMTGRWAIRWHNVTPGLYWSAPGKTHWHGPVLGAIGLTATDLEQHGSLNESNLSQIEIVRDRCELTFQPHGWHDTSVRFAWTPVDSHQFDLMTEVSTRSVGLLHGVELGIETSAWLTPENVSLWYEAMRDEAASARSIDGRESAWFAAQHQFETDENVAGTGESRCWFPTLLKSPHDSFQFLECTHPFDISRRYRDADSRTQRTWVFGYDMERGVVFRARNRIRVMTSNEAPDWNFIDEWLNNYLEEPLPLYR